MIFLLPQIHGFAQMVEIRGAVAIFFMDYGEVNHHR